MMRIIALFLALVMSLGIIYPIASNDSEARSKRHHTKKKLKKHKKKKIKKYSRAWWRRYKKRMKRKRALAARKRALQKRRAMFAKAKRKPLRKRKFVAKKKRTVRLKRINNLDKTGAVRAVAKVSKVKRVPKPVQKERVEAKYSVESSEGAQVGNAQLSVVGVAGVDLGGGSSKTVGGVATSTLRRSVIDRMLREGGWVVNDYQKELNGKKVYVVIAQSPGSDGRVNSRTFYFTEADGKIYSLATTAPTDSNEEVAEESEKLLIGLHRGNYPTQANLK